jgi:hypothetical protein
MNRLYVPPVYCSNVTEPLLFLAGPIQGAYDWQKTAIEYLLSKGSHIHIASPRRDFDLHTDFTDAMYNEQVDWETFHLRRAAKNGVIMFWLAREFKHNCERAYAQTSRVELGEWKVLHERDNVNLVVGIEDGFTGAKYIRRRFSQDCPTVPICSSLEETCDKALGLIK